MTELEQDNGNLDASDEAFADELIERIVKGVTAELTKKAEAKLVFSFNGPEIADPDRIAEAVRSSLGFVGPEEEAPSKDDRLEVLESALKALFGHNTNMWGDLELAQFLAVRGVDVSRYAAWWDEAV